MALSENLIEKLEIDFSKLDSLVKPQRVVHGDSVSVRVTVVTRELKKLDIPAELVSISPLGLLLTIDDPNIDLEMGQRFTSELRVGNQLITNIAVVVSMVNDTEGTRGYVARIVAPTNPERTTSTDRRKTPRWICNEQFYPTAIAANPGKYNDYMYFSFRDLSKNGARAVTSLRNKFIVRGMMLECLVSLPMVSQLTLRASIANVNVYSEKGKDLLSVGLEFENLELGDHQAIAQYLLQFGDTVSLQSLRDAGLVPNSVARAVSYSFVRTSEELEEVLALRHATYTAAGKDSDDFQADPYDARSKIVIGKYRGKIVASCRIFFPEESDLLEQEQYVKLPSSIGRKDQIAEIMRVCTHPDFRRGDLLISLFHFLAVTCVQAKRYIVLGCAEPHLLKVYTDIGFQDIGVEYVHKGLGNTKHRAFLADARERIQGRGVNPLIWNVVWKDTERYLSQTGMLASTPQTITRTSIYRLLGPISKVMRARMSKPRKKQRKG